MRSSIWSRDVTGVDAQLLVGIHCLVTPVKPFDSLFGRQCNQHAQNDDPDLAGELAPPVQRLWQVNVHEPAPSGAVTITEGSSGRNGSKAAVATLGGKLPLDR